MKIRPDKHCSIFGLKGLNFNITLQLVTFADVRIGLSAPINFRYRSLCIWEVSVKMMFMTYDFTSRVFIILSRLNVLSNKIY
jgi:hypothetical protein